MTLGIVALLLAVNLLITAVIVGIGAWRAATRRWRNAGRAIVQDVAGREISEDTCLCAWCCTSQPRSNVYCSHCGVLFAWEWRK